MLHIIGMTKEDLLALDPKTVDRQLSAEEIVYMARVFGAFWQYDYDAAEKGRTGMHAVLKSELHSDGFFVSKIMLEPINIRQIIANQLVLRFRTFMMSKPGQVGGVPKGATELGKEVARIFGVPVLEMEKMDGRITLTDPRPIEGGLIIEDFCTRGTGFTEAVLDIMSRQPRAKLLPFDLCILNRGGLEKISINGVGIFQVVAAVEHRINDWEPGKCPLCLTGSVPIKPKATDENWRLITTSQR
jgi:hypothetical protein